jgi:hypothetical protein
MKGPSVVFISLLLFFGSVFTALGVDTEIFYVNWQNDEEIRITLTNSGNVYTSGDTHYYSSPNPGVTYTVDTSWPAFIEYKYSISFFDSYGTQVDLSKMVYIPWYLKITVWIERREWNILNLFDGFWEVTKEYNKTLYLHRDLSGPVVTVTGAASGVTSSAVTISASASDSESGLDANTWQYRNYIDEEYKSGKSVTLSDEGYYILAFRVADMLGNIGGGLKSLYIDKTPPTVTVSGETGTSWSNASSVSLSAEGSDALSGIDSATWQYSINGGSTWSAQGSSNNSLSISAEGSRSVQFRVKDRAGHSASKAATVKIDRTPPVITLGGNMGAAWGREASRDLSISVSDVLSGVALVESSADGGLTWVDTGSKSSGRISYSGEGTFTGLFRARDSAGNTATVSGTVNLDRRSPIISGFTAPAGWIKPDVVFSGITIKDSTEATGYISGFNPESIRIRPGSYAAIAVRPGYQAESGALDAFTVSGLPNGSYTLTLSASDYAGNAGSSAIQTIKIDGAPPAFNVGVNGVPRRSGGGWSIPLLLSGVSDGHSGVNHQGWKYAIDGGAESAFAVTGSGTEYNAALVIGPLSGGTHSISITGRDNTGNQTSKSCSFVIDDGAPVISWDPLFGDGPEQAPWTNKSGFSVSAADAVSGIAAFTGEIKRLQGGVWVTTGDAVFNGSAVNFSAGTADGVFQISLQASDQANNQTGKTLYLRVDRSAPVLTIPSGISAVNSLSAAAVDSASGLDESSWEWKGEDGLWRPGKTAVLSPGRDRRIGFRVRDYAGNSAEKNGEITVDTSPPVVSAAAASFARAERLSIGGISAEDGISTVNKVWYRIDGGETHSVSPWPVQTLDVPVTAYAEGRHRIQFGAVDAAQHTGLSAEYGFIIDRSVPVIEEAELREGRNTARVLGDMDYTAANEVRVTIRGRDCYRHEGLEQEGSIVHWYWDIRRDKNALPEFSENRKSSAAEFTIQGYDEGISYLYITAEDAGGNRGVPFRRVLSKDQSIPGAPGIRSATHEEARRPEQAGFLPEAEFKFRPAYHIRSGITAYLWQLKKLVRLNDTDGAAQIVMEGSVTDLDADAGGHLSLVLEDNLEHEFYRLSVQCLGGNGLAGVSGEYQFRIDSTAPNEVRIRANPQLNPQLWYNSRDAVISWNKPADMTGVAEYRYWITADEDWLPPGEDDDPEGWERTVDMERRINIKALLGDKPWGTARAGVSAIDYAGNRKTGTGSIRSDYAPPFFEADKGEAGLSVRDESAELGASKHIRWGKVRDLESGIDYLSLIIVGDEKQWSYTLSADAEEFIAERLDQDRAYGVMLRAYDYAGNMAELHTACATGNAQVPERYVLPYGETINGFELSGERIIGPGSVEYRNIRLGIPNALALYEIKTLNGAAVRERLSAVALEDIALGAEYPQGGRSPAGLFEAEADGFVLRGNRIIFDREQGVFLGEAIYTRKMVIDGVESDRDIALGTSSLGLPPAAHFSGGPGTADGAAEIRSFAVDGNGLSVPAFPLTGVEAIGLQSGKEWFSGGSLSVNAAMPEGHALFLSTQEGTPALPLNGARAEAGTKNLEGEITIPPDKPLRLIIRGSEYAVRKAGIRGRYINIYEAVLTLPETYEPRELVLRNFILDSRNGTVHMGPDYRAGNIRAQSPGGASFTSSGIEFALDGRLIASGEISSRVYGILPVSELYVTHQGADWETGAGIPGFSAMVHGFPVTAAAVRFTREGIYIAEGKIGLYGAGRRFGNLGLADTGPDEVYAAGEITEHYYADTGYGKPLQVKGGGIDSGGVYGTVMVPLNPAVRDPANQEAWEFTGVRLYPSGAMGGELPEPRQVEIGDHPLSAEAVLFSGDKITLGRVSSGAIPGLSGSGGIFRDMVFNEERVLQPGISEAAHSFTVSGWKLDYEKLMLGQDGIGGVGALSLPSRLGGLVLEFAESLIHRDGSFTSGKVQEAADTVEPGGVPVRLRDAELLWREGAYVLGCAAPVLSLRSLEGPELYLGETLFDAAGTVLYGGKGRERVKFVSSNGYRVDTDSYGIDQDGVRLDGSLGALWWDDEAAAAVTGTGIRLLPGYGVSGSAPNAEAPYHYGDWQITGRDVSFEADRIKIKSNQVSYRGAEIGLGELVFNPQGNLSGAVVSPQNLEVPLVWGLGIVLTETRFHSGGLDAIFVVKLPAFLGDQALRFESIRLEADGNFRVETLIEEHQFTLGGFEFTLKGITLESTGIYAEAAGVLLPEAQERRSIVLTGLRINREALTIEDAAVSPFKMWGMVFKLNEFTLRDNQVSLGGIVELPETMPGTLAGHSLEIRKFVLGLDGAVAALDVRSEEMFTVPFLEAWALSVNLLEISYLEGQPWIVIHNGLLRFPQGYGAEDAYIDQIRFNPLTGAFDYGAITARADIRMSFWGIEFVLNQLRIDHNLSAGFSGSVLFPSIGVPGFIAGKTAAIETFEIQKDGSLGSVAITIPDLEGELFPGADGIILRNGAAGLIKHEGRSLLISITGDVILTSVMPEPFAGSVLRIEAFTIDPSIPKITQLKVKALLPDPVFFGNRLSQITAEILWDEAGQEGQLDLSGLLKLPGSFPAFLAGKEIPIRDFKIGFDGSIRSFAAQYSSAPGEVFNALGAIQLADIFIDVSLGSGSMAFDLAGTLILPAENFPEGIGGNRTAVRMQFDTLSGLVSAYGSMAIVNQKLFGTLGVRNLFLDVYKEAHTDLNLFLRGQLILPETFPQGLRGTAVDIRRFTLNSTGGITELDVGLSGINTRIFGLAELKEGSLDFALGGKDEFIINMDGRVRLIAAALPQSLRDTELAVNKLELSTKSGLKSFEVGLGSSLSFTILGGILVRINSLFLNESYITLDAGAYLPAHYPPGLADTQIDLRVLTLGWDGGIIDIQGGLGAMNFSLAGFSVWMEQLYFEKNTAGQFAVSLSSCRLQLPPNIGSLSNEYVAVKNAWFSPETGLFLGDIEVPSMVTDIAGFRLDLQNPYLELSQGRIGFTRGTIYTPDFMGNAAITLSGVHFSAKTGLQFSGGGFKIPGFDVGGLRFSNVQVDFSYSDSEYILGGQGSVFIPGAGTIDAALSFVSKSGTYPLGLKRAEFSYILAAGGIPLGNSGLFLNGIMGGISYGPPDELPRKVQAMFEAQGPRLKLGLHVGDAYGGSILDMSPTVWVDVSNASWAFQGTATILKGKLDMSAELTAALTGAGFYGGAEIELKFVRGGVDVYIYNKAGKVIFSGEGYVQFGLSQGAILDTTIAFIRIQVPPGDMWLGSINASFGQFSNGKTGFKGTVELPLLGTQGVFVAPGEFTIGDVSSYAIEKPSWAPSSLRGSRLPSEGAAENAAENTGSAVNALNYQVLIPPKDRGLERLVFILAYTQGSPELTAVSPSGTEYREGSLKTETVFMENVLALIVYAPEAGTWNVRLANIEEEFFELRVMGGERAPQLEITEPSYAITRVTESFRVRGITELGAEILIHAREELGKPGRELGIYQADGEGVFDAEVSVADLPDGEYFISAQILTEAVSPVSYAAGKILVDRSALPLNAPGALRAAETDRGTLTLHWENTNGGRNSDYTLKVLDITGNKETVFSTGNISAVTLPGYEAGRELSIAVNALDGAGRASPYTPPVRITLGAERPEHNRPRIADAPIRAAGLIGGFVEGVIPVEIGDRRDLRDASAYISARETGLSSRDFGRVYFGEPALITADRLEIPWYAGISDALSPGTYRFSGEAVNEANGLLSAPFQVELHLDWPRPEIHALEPAELNGKEENRITVYGSGFVPGTRIFWRGEELPRVIHEGGQSWGTVEFLLPPQSEAGTYPLTLRGPGGETAEFPLEVVLPDWNLTLYTRSVETVAGGEAYYALGVSGIHGFEGPVEFSVLSKAPEAEVLLPVIPVDSIGTIRITMAPGTAAGTYNTIIGGGGKTFELITLVRDEPPDPWLSGLSPAAGYAGGEIRVFGYALGGEGELYLNGELTETLSWTEAEIVFVVPDKSTGGYIQAVTAGGSSNRLAFTLRDRGFSIRPGSSRLEMTAGEELTVPLSVTGYADTVYLRAEAEPGSPFSVELEKSSLKPNGIVNLRVRAGSDAENGIWKLTVRGSGRSYEALTGISVRIGNSFTLDDKPLPQALVGAAYYAKLESNYGAGETSYYLSGGDLPLGLALSRQGEIRGRPEREGRYPFAVEGRDEAGRTSGGQFVINVREDAWAQAGKDGGMSRAAGTELPGERRVDWTFAGPGPADYLIAAEGHILAVYPQGLTALESAGGRPVWESQVSYRKVIYAGGRVYALTGEAVLEARDMAAGTLLWSREGIRGISGNGALILAGTDGGYMVIDAAQGALLEKGAASLDPEAEPIWLDNSAFVIEEKRLRPVYGSDFAWESDEAIYAAAADAGGFALATEQSLVLLDRELRETLRVPRRNTPETRLSLTETGLLLSGEGLVSEYRREDLSLAWVHAGTGEQTAAAGLDKAAVAGPGGLQVLNRCTGSLIWEDPEPCRALAIYRERIYAAGEDGRIRAFGGPANPHPPETLIEVQPAAPDGANGWYMSGPALHIRGTDRETYVTEARMRFDDEEWQDAPESLILEDGEHRISAYTVDSGGLRSPEVQVLLRVDTTVPESAYSPSAAEPPGGWYTGPVEISLEAWDELSGIDRIVSSRGTYTGPLIFAEQGVHNFTWYALDKAGNREALRRREIRIDQEAPFTEIRASYDRGIVELSLSARDRISGTALIEYRIDGGPAEPYREPLVLTQEGRHGIQYRAADLAGNYEEWHNGEIWVSPSRTGPSLIEESRLNGAGRLVMYNARNGLPLLRGSGGGEGPGFDPAAPEALARLPSYTIGGEYPLWEAEDLDSGLTAEIRFRLSRDALVYLFLPPGTEAPEGWSFIEERPGINRTYYPRGAAVYMRRYHGGSWVEIPGSPVGRVPPLALAQEWGSVLGDIAFRRAESPGEENPQAESAGAGTPLVLEALVSPWTYSRRLPLRQRWSVNTGDGWLALEGNRYTLPDEPGPEPPRFRLELYTPDGRTEHLAEKTLDMSSLE